MTVGEFVRIASILTVASLSVASCKDGGPTVGSNGEIECGTCQRTAVKCKGESEVICVPTIEDAQPQGCIPEQSVSCTPGSGGSGGAGS